MIVFPVSVDACRKSLKRWRVSRETLFTLWTSLVYVRRTSIGLIPFDIYDFCKIIWHNLRCRASLRCTGSCYTGLSVDVNGTKPLPSHPKHIPDGFLYLSVFQQRSLLSLQRPPPRTAEAWRRIYSTIRCGDLFFTTECWQQWPLLSSEFYATPTP